MSWVYLDDKFHSNQKVLEVGNDGAGLYCRALSYCGDHLTDGYVPFAWAKTAGTAKLRGRLLDHGMWIEVKPGDWYEVMVGEDLTKVEFPTVGYFIPDYLLSNPSKAKVLDKRNKRAAAGRLGAAAKHSKDVANATDVAMANATANCSVTAGESHTPPTPTPPQLLKPPQTPPSGGQGIWIDSPLGKLLNLFPDPGARQKIHRTVNKNHPSESKLLDVVSRCSGKGVRDPLAVALAELAKRRAA